ncbi:L-threonylcarbamoyladenylate synthase [Psychrobacter aestuarii]|nr:Sua5/YciO/YrdC/YwlC family protein [Psychrobacter aestuarii]
MHKAQLSEDAASVIHEVSTAATWLRAGHLLAYPTESVWGIGCDPFNEDAVETVLAIKARPKAKGMILVTDDIERIAPLLAGLTPEQRASISSSWQPQQGAAQRQANTWLLPITDTLPVGIPAWVTGAHDSVAVRVTDHPLVKSLCAALVSEHNPYGFLVSTSCNPATLPPAKTLAEARAYFAHSDYAPQVRYLQGDTLGYELPSQIRDAVTGAVIR